MNHTFTQSRKDSQVNSHYRSLSVVVPCKDEEEVLNETHRRLTSVLAQSGLSFEIIYVDDGSTDSTSEVLRQLCTADEHIRVLRLSRNFGHQMATTAGLEHATGDAVIIIDADLQDPPEVILAMVARWREGYDVAYGLRTDRNGETAFKLYTAKIFYRLINRLSNVPIPIDTGDFRLMDRRVVNALLLMPERDRFLRGMITWLGYRQGAVPYERHCRFAGTSKYPILKMARFAVDGILSFSMAPLKLATAMGSFASLLAVLGCMYALLARIFTNHWVPGWTSIFLAVLFIGGIQLTCLGIIGEYIGRIYNETKRRPLYFLQEKLGFDRSNQGCTVSEMPHLDVGESNHTRQIVSHAQTGG